MRGLTEGGLAAVTFVRFFSGVDATMVPERSVTCKTFVTNLTHVWLLSAVSSLVILQMWRLRELHTAGSTFVRFFTGVDAHMVFQINCLRERYTAHVAFVILFTRMQLLVGP